MGQISGISPPVSPEKRGGSRSSRNARWDAVDAAASARSGIAGRVCPVSDIVSAGRWRQCSMKPLGRDGPVPMKPLGEDGRLRTAKACGPGTRCWCQVGGGDVGPTGRGTTINPPATVTRRIRRRGGRAISRKAIAQGRPDASAEPVCSCACSCAHLAHETAGAARPLSSLRPLFSRDANLGRMAPREGGRTPVPSLRGAQRRSNPFLGTP